MNMKINLQAAAIIIALFTISDNTRDKLSRSVNGQDSGVIWLQEFLTMQIFPNHLTFNKMINVRWKTEIPGLGSFKSRDLG